MLSSLTYLNVRHELPRIGIDMQAGTLSSRVQQPQSSGTYRAPRSTQGVVQAKVDIDSYPSRHAYGARKMSDFTAEQGQRGKDALRQATSRHTQQAWTNCDQAARKGVNVITQKYKGELSAKVRQQRHIVAQAIPDPTITVYPAQVQGDIDPGEHSIQIRTEPRADVTYNPGRFRGYLAYKGTIQRWTSTGKYDA